MSEHNSKKPKYIAIEGNIGAGKTSLCNLLAKDWGCHLVLEQFTDNPFLPLFYDNPERYAFQVELFFMTERYKQLQEQFANQNLFNQQTVADYFFLKTLLFAKKNLLNEEYRLFHQLFQTLNTHAPTPDLLVYLHRPVAALQKNIQKRGRLMENQIEDSYLDKVQAAYFEYFKMDSDFPVLVINLEDKDFVGQPTIYQEVKLLIEQAPTEKKVHYSANSLFANKEYM